MAKLTEITTFQTDFILQFSLNLLTLFSEKVCDTDQL